MRCPRLGLPTRRDTVDDFVVAEWTKQGNGGYVVAPGLPGGLITMQALAVPVQNGSTMRLWFKNDRLVDWQYREW